MNPLKAILEHLDEKSEFISTQFWSKVTKPWIILSKPVRNHNKASTRDAINKERQIMNEIIKKDTENVTESDSELCELWLLQEEGANEIDGTIEVSVLLTEIPKSENCKEQVETIEVIDIVRKLCEIISHNEMVQ